MPLHRCMVSLPVVLTPLDVELGNGSQNFMEMLFLDWVGSEDSTLNSRSPPPPPSQKMQASPLQSDDVNSNALNLCNLST